MEALWHVFTSGEREEGGKSGAAAGWVTVPWAMEKGVACKRTVQDAHGLVCAKKEKKINYAIFHTIANMHSR